MAIERTHPSSTAGRRLPQGPRTRSLRASVVVLAVLTGVTFIGIRPAAAAPCHVAWGSTAEVRNVLSPTPITGVRAGRHACFDRLVIDLRGTVAPGWNVRYVSQVLTDGAGAVVPLRGGARIHVTVGAPAYDSLGRPTYRPANSREAVSTAGMRTFRQVAYAGSFEGYTTFGLGVRARLPFRVFVLSGPGATTRLVIDVAHTWA